MHSSQVKRLKSEHQRVQSFGVDQSLVRVQFSREKRVTFVTGVIASHPHPTQNTTHQEMCREVWFGHSK